MMRVVANVPACLLYIRHCSELLLSCSVIESYQHCLMKKIQLISPLHIVLKSEGKLSPRIIKLYVGTRIPN